MEKHKIKIGRIITLSLVGTSLLAMLAGPSAMAQTNGTATATGLTTKQQPARGEGRGERMPPRDEMKQDMKLDLKDVTITVAYLDNGIKETFVSTTQSVIAQMKKFVTRINAKDTNKDEKKGEDVKINVVAEATATGMVITTTTTDADAAARIINQAKIRELEKKLIDAKVDIKAATTRTVTETDKGVTISITSDNADVASLIKLREKYGMQGPRGMMEEGKGFGMGKGKMGKGRQGNRGAGLPDNQDATEGVTQSTTTQDSNL